MLYAFFDRAGNLDQQAMRRQAEACVAAGADGLAVLGLATEVQKLSEMERLSLVATVVEAVGGRAPLAVTVAGETPAAQALFARQALDLGASWLVLQPPVERVLAEPELLDFFTRVASGIDSAVGIQNAPAYIGSGLSNAGFAELARRAHNVSVLKWEGPALNIPQVIAETGGKLAIFNGRGGLEFIDNFRAGCAGLMPASEVIDIQTRIYRLMQAAETESEAERLYAEMLPLTVFLMQSLDILICYGKRLAARRLGLGEVHDRAPGLAPSPLGLSLLARYANTLGQLAA